MSSPVGDVTKGPVQCCYGGGNDLCNGVQCDWGTELYNAILMINHLFIQKLNMTSNKAQIDVYVNGKIYGFLYIFSSHISGSLSLKATGDSIKWAKWWCHTERNQDNF